MWAVLMVEQEQQMVGADHGKRKELCSVINYLANLPAAQVLYVRICRKKKKKEMNCVVSC